MQNCETQCKTVKHDAKLQKKTMHNFETQYKTTNTIQNSEKQSKTGKHN